jgi:uncharacterized protein DUF3551
MRSLIGLAALIAALAADANLAGAQESFFNDRYCSRGMGSFRSGGSLDCSYRTWAQCIESARGLGRYCLENPWWRPQSSARARPRRYR